MTPGWIFDLLAAVMLAVAALSAARLVAARPWPHGAATVAVDGADLLMALAMAGMLTSALRTFPDAGWEVVFGILIAWFAFRVLRDFQRSGARALAGGHCAPHLVHAGSMLYMFLATTTVGGMAGMAGMNELPGSSGSAMVTLNYPTLAFAFAIVLSGYSVWDLDQLSGHRYRLAPARLPQAGFSPAAGAGLPTMAAVARDQSVPPGASTADRPADTADSADTAVSADTIEFLLSPAVTAGCRVALGVVMAFILIIAI